MSDRGAAPGTEDTEYLYVLLRRSTRELERLEGVGLSRARVQLRPAHVSVLAALLEASPLTPGEIAARCELEPSTLTGLLRALEKQALIERQKVVLDQRSQVVSLTSRGRAASRVAIRIRAEAQADVLHALPRELTGHIGSWLAKLAVAAQKAADAGSRRKGRRRR